MKSIGFIMYIFIFLMKWAGLTVGGWETAQQYAAGTLTPWIITLLNKSPHIVSQAMGCFIAVAASFSISILLAVLAFTLIGIGHRVRKAFRGLKGN